MRLVRSILALAIVAALAWLPLSASAAGVAPIHDVAAAHAAAHMAPGMMPAGDAAMDDCCPDGMKSPASDHDDGKCPMGACCVAAASVVLADVVGVGVDRHPVGARRLGSPADQVLSRLSGNPPFRPPRA